MYFRSIDGMVVQKAKVAAYMAWVRLSAEHAKLKLGLFWEVLSLGFIVVFLSIVWGRVLESGEFMGYFLYVLQGFTVWSLMSRCIDQCTSIKGRLFATLRKGGVDIKVFVASEVFYALLYFMIVFPIVLGFSIFVGDVSLLGLIYVVIVIILILATAWGLMLSLGLLAVLYEDIGKLIRTVMRVAFLLTPVIWYPEMLGENSTDLLYLNPFYCYLDVFRSGLSSHEVNLISLIAVFLETSVTFIAAVYVYKHFSNKVLQKIFIEI